MKEKRFQWDTRMILGLSAWVVLVYTFIHIARGSAFVAKTRALHASKGQVAQSVGPALRSNQFPNEVDVPLAEGSLHALATYTLDILHQQKIEKLLQQYRPDYAAFVALDAETGRVLVLASYTRSNAEPENLALKASFPAASVFKIVTAAAAIDQGVLSAETIIPFNGANHTLYRRNVTDQNWNRWTRQMTVRDAFAKSVNTVFAKIGMYVLEPLQLQDYAERFQFNKALQGDLPVEKGLVTVGEDPWGFAEVASGFNRVSSMSPLQGALIAAAVANDGVMMEPFVVERLMLPNGPALYEATPVPTSVTMKAETAEEIRTLMRETVISGTSRAAFRTLVRQPAYRELEIGGKTGSLRGTMPQGKCDWFVGYARSPEKRIAFAALTVNEDKWRVKASYLARTFVGEYFKPVKTTAVR